MNNKKLWAVTDIESRKWIEFLCIGYYDGNIYEYFLDLTSYFNFLFSPKNKCSLIYAHFGGIFDFLFLLNYILHNTNIYKLKSIIPRGSGILSFKVSVGKRTITFSDSSALLPFSLRSLAENFKVETQKGVINYNRITKVTPKLLSYMEDDHKALYQIMKRYESWPMVEKVGLKSTIASQALAIFRDEYEIEDRKLPVISPDIEIFSRNAYKGGRTEIFRPYFNQKKGQSPLYYYDVNSLYPYVMKKNDYPTYFDYYTCELETGKLGIYHLQIEVPKTLKIPILGIIHEGKYIFPTGKIEGYWTTPEIKYAMKLGCKILKINQGIIFKSGDKLFKNYVDKLYKIRENSNKKSVDNVLAKLLLNSLYGRFGLDREKETVVIDDGSEGLIPYIKFEIKKNVFIRLAKKPIKIKSFNNVAIAAFVTAYARIHMHKIYQKCGNDLYYSDTDSIITTKKFPTSSKLGDLKLEKTIKKACFLLPKTYIIENDDFKSVVMKGFDQKKIQHFGVDDFFSGLEGDLRRLKSNIEEKPARFKSALRKGKLLSMTEKSTKQIRSQYDKRIFIKSKNSWSSDPIHLT